MANQNWNDHDRSGRYTARDFGYDYLETCAPQGIIFTNGDNDTFPLWYDQEVEGYRTDARVCNLSYLQTDWYVDQMKRKAYKSDPLPINFTRNQYVQGTRDIVYILDQIKRPIDLKEAIDFVRSDDPNTKLQQYDNAAYLPSRQLVYPVNKKMVLENSVVAPQDTGKIVKQMEINLTGNYITKDELMILDMIANNDWKRPIYFAITVGRDKYLNLQDYFETDGFAYRIVPIKTPPSQNGQVGSVRTGLMYNNLMNKFRWGNMNDPKVYLDENNRRMAMNIRNIFVRLADALVDEGKRDSAAVILDKCNELIPNSKIEYNYFNMLMIETYYKAAGRTLADTTAKILSETPVNQSDIAKANEIVKIMARNTEDELIYYFSLKPDFRATVQDDLQRAYYIMRSLADISTHYGEKKLGEEVTKRLNDVMSVYQPELAVPQRK